MPLDSLCYSTYFPAGEGGTMDTKYFAETFYPKFASTYGTDAVPPHRSNQSRHPEVASPWVPAMCISATKRLMTQ